MRSVNRFQSTWSSWWLAHPNQQDGNGEVLNRKMLVVVPLTRYTNYTFMVMEKKKKNQKTKLLGFYIRGIWHRK